MATPSRTVFNVLRIIQRLSKEGIVTAATFASMSPPDEIFLMLAGLKSSKISCLFLAEVNFSRVGFLSLSIKFRLFGVCKFTVWPVYRAIAKYGEKGAVYVACVATGFMLISKNSNGCFCNRHGLKIGGGVGLQFQRTA